VKDKDALWQYDRSPVQRQPQTLTFIPWFSWANRGEGEMRIWVDEGIITFIIYNIFIELGCRAH
jgi:DUF1680 family protein